MVHGIALHRTFHFLLTAATEAAGSVQTAADVGAVADVAAAPKTIPITRSEDRLFFFCCFCSLFFFSLMNRRRETYNIKVQVQQKTKDNTHAD